jgi:hypothetical protein
MTRLLTSIALAAALAVSSAVFADGLPTHSATINNVKVSGVGSPPANGTPAPDSHQNPLDKVQDTRPAMPTLAPPPAISDHHS